MPSYDDLAHRLLAILEGVYDDDNVLIFPKSREQEEYEGAVACAVCEHTKMTPETWGRLSHSQRIPWLESAIGKAAEQRAKAVMPDPAGGEFFRSAEPSTPAPISPLAACLWPPDLGDVATSARKIIQLTDGMLRAARLPEDDPDRHGKLSSFGVTFVSSSSQGNFFNNVETVRNLLPELRRASKKSGVSIPRIWDLPAECVAELAAAIGERGLAMYMIPATGSTNLPAQLHVGGYLFLKGNDLSECRRRLQSLPLFDAAELCQMIDDEIGVAAQLRVVGNNGTATTIVPVADDDSKWTRFLHDFLWMPAADPALTKGFKGKRHDDLLLLLQAKLDKDLGGRPRSIFLQSLQDAGCDLVIDWGNTNKCGIQLKSYGDISDAEFARITMAQIQTSREHGLNRLYVLLAGDMTDPSHKQKVPIFEGNISKQNDPYVVTVSPDRLWTLLFGDSTERHPTRPRLAKASASP